MVMADKEAKAAVQMVNTALDGTSRIIQALIDALTEQARNPKDRATLRTFQDYVSQGGRLLTISVDKSCASDFEGLLGNSGITLYKTETAYNPSAYAYLFRQEDERIVEGVVMRMRRGGIDMVRSSRTDYNSLMEQSSGKLHTGICHDPREAGIYRLRLDTLGIPYAWTEYPDRTEIAVASDNYDRIRSLPDMAGLRLERIDRKVTMREVSEIVQEAAEKRLQETERKKTREQGKTRG